MRSFNLGPNDSPFIRYLRGMAPTPPPTEDTGLGASGTDTLVDTGPRAAARPGYPAGMESSRMAAKARQAAAVGGWMSAIRLVSHNAPLLAVPKSRLPQSMDLLGALKNPAGVTTFAVKDFVCMQAENITGKAAYVTRIARWTARAAACAWFTTVRNVPYNDVAAWLSRPDYNYPRDCSPKAGLNAAHCPSAAVGQAAEGIEPFVGAILLGATGVATAWGLWRLDLALHRRAAASRAIMNETADVQAPLLGSDGQARHSPMGDYPEIGDDNERLAVSTLADPHEPDPRHLPV